MPKVSIVIPVYKVEQYLVECLNSLLAQTLRDIEIICVNDGSPDLCPQMLDNYAAGDSRITVIHKENGGLSSARNAAYPYIRGEYTLFVDSDDYIEPTLCEKTVAVADHERADMTLFLYTSTSPLVSRTALEKFLDKHSFSEIDISTLSQHATAWSKLWRSHFLLDNQLKFPEGLYCEDNVVHWEALMLHPILALVPEKLYRYRYNPDSITGAPSSKLFHDIGECFEIIRTKMKSEQKYEGFWKEALLERKLRSYYSRSLVLDDTSKPLFFEALAKYYGDDERNFIKNSAKLRRDIRDFYFALDGSRMARIRSSLNRLAVKLYRTVKEWGTDIF